MLLWKIFPSLRSVFDLHNLSYYRDNWLRLIPCFYVPWNISHFCKHFGWLPELDVSLNPCWWIPPLLLFPVFVYVEYMGNEFLKAIATFFFCRSRVIFQDHGGMYSKIVKNFFYLPENTSFGGSLADLTEKVAPTLACLLISKNPWNDLNNLNPLWASPCICFPQFLILNQSFGPAIGRLVFLY